MAPKLKVKKVKKPKITNPMTVTHVLHVDKDLQWSFDDKVKPETIFKKIQDIGEGGFGTVIKLLHVPSNTILAGKSINPDLVNSKSKVILNKEIEMMRQIVSDYTIHYYGHIMFNKRMTILMEFCQLGSFRDLIDCRGQVLTEQQVQLVMKDLLNGLLILHEKHKIVHRDIKAANILLGSNGICRVADFGVSRQFHDGTLSFSTQSVVGTPYWMAPEIINGEKYSFPADVWSIASTAVELAEGAPPYCEFPSTRAMVQIATSGFPGFRFPARFSDLFNNFIISCTGMDPNGRPTVRDLLTHPFVQEAEKLNRSEVFAPLLKTQVDFKKLLQANDEEPPDGDEFQKATMVNIRTARKTLRGSD
ncbi:STE family protein kinase [Tritrichomonas foetus]|uniref:non-specific serine/threonine protein kinase n=1 Tax=Tritrichomonas foetus TaxID=1144522 RepID=A0A1J4JEA3_9EUKA|nr:STE family protein kinase [Tritrichomonas foetus]|eukprot:OHS95588.1 STE family protein kinase [Tritrichomonas foetus]